jgi:betaine-aldehyde dehydrogenase
MAQRLFIDGQFQLPASGGYIDVVDPATGQVFDKIASGEKRDIDAAVVAARRAFDSGWGHTSGSDRSVVLKRIADEIRARKDLLAQMEVRDNGKPLAEAAWDIDDAAGCFDYYADLARALDRMQDEELALPDDRFVSSVRYEPAGVVGLIVPWNYPLLMAAWKVAPALAAGCTAVLKPSELTSLTALELSRIAADIQLPAGVLNVVTGLGPTAGAALAEHPGVDKLAFTGSVPTGRRVMVAAAQDIKAISLELGGKSPFVVFDDADIADAVEWIMFGIFWNQGEVCSATSRLIVHAGIHHRLVEALVEASRAIRIGSGLEAGTQLGPLVSNGQRAKVAGVVSRAHRSGARLLCGGEPPPHMRDGFFFAPTIFDDVDPHAELWREEVFGPVLAVRSFETEEEAITLANDSRFGLAAAVMSSDMERCRRVASRLRAGIVWVNCSQPTFTQAPWGGMKQSGIGRELGRWGLMNYLEPKQITSFVKGAWNWYRPVSQ